MPAAALTLPLPRLVGHGIGGGAELPLSPWTFGYLAGAAVVVTSGALGTSWPRSRLEPSAPAVTDEDDEDNGDRNGPGVVVLRVLGVLGLLVVVGAAAFGSEIVTQNLAPVAVYVVFWAGLTVVCSLVFDVWNRGLDPVSTLGRLVAPASERPYRLGAWPAAAGVGVFVWLQLVHPDRARPRTLAVLIVAYLVVVLAAAMAWGRPFLRRGEPFAVWFGLLGAMAPLRRDVGTGRIRRGTPVAGLARIDASNGVVALVLVVLGSTLFDAVRESAFWSGIVGARSTSEAVPLATLGLVVAVAVVAGLYLGSVRLAADVAGRPPMELARMYVHSLVPIAAAYVTAHALPLLVVEGQAVIALVSDPFGAGWNLFGTADRSVDYTLVSPITLAWVQAAVVVAGHVAAVVLAHDRAVARLPQAVAVRSQYPLVAAYVAFAIGGLGLLLGG